jgi:hypothetical protein
MHDSMNEFCSDFRIFAFCMDDESYATILSLGQQSVVPVSYRDLEAHDTAISSVKQTRSLIEYYFTCTPAISCYVFDKFDNINLLTYLDSDLLFFSSPEPIFEEIGDKSLAIVEHRFSKYGRKFLNLGIFNVAWITYRRDIQGIECLQEYRQQCIDWCFDYLDGDKYADQKYLDKWPQKYSGLVVIKNKGVNLACWNVGNYKIERKGDTILVDGNKLIFYHFAGLRQKSDKYFTTSISSYLVKPNRTIKSNIYSFYIKKLRSVSLGSDITKKTVNPKYSNISLKRLIINCFRNLRMVLFGDLIKV